MEADNKRFDKTLVELLAAASEFAFEWSNSDKEAYQMARLAMVEILKSASQPIEFDEELEPLVIKNVQSH